MPTTQKPTFETIADAVHFLEENRELIDAYQDYQARLAYERKREILIREKDAQIAELDARIAQADALIAENDARLAEKNTRIAELDARLAEQKKAIAARRHGNFFGLFSKWKNNFRKH